MSREKAKELLSNYLWQMACDCRGDNMEVQSIVDEIVDAAVAEAAKAAKAAKPPPSPMCQKHGSQYAGQCGFCARENEPRLRRSVKDRLLDITGMSFSPERPPAALYDREGNMVFGVDMVILLHGAVDFIVRFDKEQEYDGHQLATFAEALTRLPEGA